MKSRLESKARSAAAPKAARVTLREVAAAAGVSDATVSLALRDHPRIPAETRERIRQLVAGETFGERFVTKILGRELGL